MTISEEERQRLLGEREEVTVTYPKYQRSGVMASLMGMLAGLGMLVFVSALLAAGAILMSLEFDLIRTATDVREMSIVGVVIAALVVLVSALVGGVVAGRVARWGGIVVGLMASLWLMIVLVMFAGLTLAVGAVSATFDGFGLADRLGMLDTTNLRTAAALTLAGLSAVALLGGLLGGRLGETGDGEIRTVVDVRDPDRNTTAPAIAEPDEPGRVDTPLERVLSDQQPPGRHVDES